MKILNLRNIFKIYVGVPGNGSQKMINNFRKIFLDEGEKSDKIEKNNFSQNLDHYCFGPPANRTPLTISFKNQWKIEKNRVQGKKPCTFFRYLQSHFSRNSPLSLLQSMYSTIVLWYCSNSTKLRSYMQ